MAEGAATAGKDNTDVWSQAAAAAAERAAVAQAAVEASELAAATERHLERTAVEVEASKAFLGGGAGDGVGAAAPPAPAPAAASPAPSAALAAKPKAAAAALVPRRPRNQEQHVQHLCGRQPDGEEPAVKGRRTDRSRSVGSFATAMSNASGA